MIEYFFPMRPCTICRSGKFFRFSRGIGRRVDVEHLLAGSRQVILDDDTIDVVTMVYSGLVNKKMVAQLQSIGCNAMGLSGADANLIPATKRPVKEIDYGFAGDIDNTSILP